MAKPNYVLDDPRTEVYVGDCREVLRTIPGRSVDLIFADPPFNWDVPYGEWNDAIPREEYLRFTYEWLDGCLATLSDRPVTARARSPSTRCAAHSKKLLTTPPEKATSVLISV